MFVFYTLKCHESYHLYVCSKLLNHSHISVRKGMIAIAREAEYLSENPAAMLRQCNVEGISEGLIGRRLSLQENQSICLSLYLNGIIQVVRGVCGELRREGRRLIFCATPAKRCVSVSVAKINVISLLAKFSFRICLSE
jgi:hypothetical protein